MGIEAGIAAAATWLGASAATAATIGTVGAGALAVGGGMMAMKELKKSPSQSGPVAGTSVMGPQTPNTTQKEEDLTLGSGRDKEGGRMRGRRQLMAPQSATTNGTASQSPTGAQGLRV